MANLDMANGFTPLYKLTGGSISSTQYKAGGTIYKGDLVSAEVDGTVKAAVAGDGDKVVGVAAHYAESGESIAVYDDPTIVYRVQASTGVNIAFTDIFATANHIAGTGNSVTKVSGHELDSSSVGIGNQMRILRKIEDGKNDWGEHVDLEVILVKSIYHNANTI